MRGRERERKGNNRDGCGDKGEEEKYFGVNDTTFTPLNSPGRESEGQRSVGGMDEGGI
jgi:hypothetical protein